MNPEKINPDEQSGLSSIDTTEVISLLKKYNDQFGMGKTLFRIIGSSDKSDINEDSNPDTKTTVSNEQAAEELLSFDEIKALSESLLNTLGLEYQPMKASWSITGSNENHVGSEMRLNLKDGSRFVKYLKSLTQEEITESQKDGLKEIVSVLIKQFDTYDLEDFNDDRLLQFMGSLSSIVDECKRLFGENNTLSEDITKLETYLSYARKNCLREYCKVEKFNLDKPLVGKGFVLRWHIDASPEYLKKEWDSVIDTLKMVSDNRSAVDLYNLAKDNALKALDSAIQEVSVFNDSDRNKIKFLSILDTTKSRLSEF